ncbi:hypothetical protein [Hymenobacter cellulosilyticus]|uniref:ASCH domain-containing protein n=1 Tax=Hymenobacter cellulosilyticus TaxID=2932248 RepID=A0A8T9Q2Y4_9BACT|nr:hypothetical protein [Hymenobacter cellulosilyticus]UOQ70821.1 hypothetical protein MUN79_19325 [Hymenobacter cellulosilyticus]
MCTSIARTISFNAVMLEALRANRKTVTRRRLASGLPLNHAPDNYQFLAMENSVAQFQLCGPTASGGIELVMCPHGQPGDLLHVLEAPEIVLKISAVRAERLQSITEAEALAEGFAAIRSGTARQAFRTLIDAIYPSAWSRNEWVWVLEFERVQ